MAYIIEVGWWASDSEAASLRAYLQKGGFILVDDFKVRGGAAAAAGGNKFEANMKRVMPEGRFLDLSVSHPIFHSFFDISRSTSSRRPTMPAARCSAALFEDNDPEKRMLMIVNYNTDMSQFWEWSGTGRPVDETNEAYKLGVNYIMYGMTH